MAFEDLPRYESVEPGVVIVRAGTQMNCGGIAEVTLRARATDTPSIELSYALTPSEHVALGRVAGAALPANLRDAFEKGARRAYAAGPRTRGLTIEVLAALHHVVDSSESRFTECGHHAVERLVAEEHQ
jgi:hypothetical protein